MVPGNGSSVFFVCMCVGSYICKYVCVCEMFMCTCPCVYLCIEANGQPQVFSHRHSDLAFERGSFTVLELAEQLGCVASAPRDLPAFASSRTGIISVHQDYKCTQRLLAFSQPLCGLNSGPRDRRVRSLLMGLARSLAL